MRSIAAVVLKTLALSALATLATPLSAGAGVRVIVGPTPIDGGEAKSARDITVVNQRLAFALAIESPMPYGIARGALIDVAVVRDGRIGRDRVVFADFIPNAWSAWPNTYQHVQILERGPDRAVIRIERDWGKVAITTVYTLSANADAVEIQTTMRNTGAAPLTDLRSGLTLWPKGGYFFGVPGVANPIEGKSDGALADRVVAYDHDWSVALHAPYFDRIANGSRDLFRMHTLAAGASRAFDGWLQVGARGDLAPVLRSDIEHGHLPSGVIRGAVRGADGTAVTEPVIVIEERGRPYAWTMGRDGAYSVALPAGRYSIYATAKNYSQSAPVAVDLRAGHTETRDFRDLQNPGRVHFTIDDAANRAPLDARIVISEGRKPVVEFLGRKTFFTELYRRGIADFAIAPGRYVFTVTSGGEFFGPARRLPLTVAPGRTAAAALSLTRMFDPAARGWYGADLHHHADQAEAVTPPDDLARSQFAAGLDLLFVSDHDSTVNHRALQAIADRRAVAFIPSIEFSPSWGHFNAYPLRLGEKPAIDPGTATIDDILREARRLGASVVQVNHPFIPYGYFTSLIAGVAPGGFNPGFDLIEINAEAPADDDKVLRALWSFWNAGHRYYLSAGTDTHDVWNEESGILRTFAHLDGPVNAHAYAAALQAGHAYVSYGPLIYPSVDFGAQLRIKPGARFSLGFDLESVAGLKSITLIERGAVRETRRTPNAAQRMHAEFALAAGAPTWFALIVEDRQGHKAYTNPIWVDPVPVPAALMPRPHAHPTSVPAR